MKDDIRTASLAELRRVDEGGKLRYSPDAMPGEDLGDAFRAGAALNPPRDATTLQPSLDPGVFAFFGRDARDAAHRIEILLEAYANQQR